MPAAGEEGAGLDQLVDDGLVGLALLALGVEDLQAVEEGDMSGRRTKSSSDVVGHPVDEAVLHEELVVVGAVARGHVDEAGAGVVGDEVAGEHRDLVGPVRVERARRDGAAIDAGESGRASADALVGRRRGAAFITSARELVGQDERVARLRPGVGRRRR